jgi:hypothetical protein
LNTDIYFSRGIDPQYFAATPMHHRTRTQHQDRESRIAFSELAMPSPLLGSVAHESVN